MKAVLLFICVMLCSITLPAQGSPLSPEQVAVIINDVDPQSIAVGRYYKKVRRIPDENIIYVSFFSDGSSISLDAFAPIRKIIAANTLPRILAYAITWTTPYRVDCMSMTSAITFGLDQQYCAVGCQPTRSSPLYQQVAFGKSAIKDTSGVRILPSMMLAGEDEKSVLQLIERGVRADSRYPRSANAYLLNTSDEKRNIRSEIYQKQFMKLGSNSVKTHLVHTDFLYNENDVMFYFTGSESVPYVGKNQFLPGAVADHLTSAGGMLTDSYQMSILRWLEAGATASYGTVVEPCNFPEKFPDPSIVMAKVIAGESLVNAYWASVKMPGQGVFVGEPMAAPFKHNPNGFIHTD